MADLISPSGLLPDTIYTGYALNKFSWKYDSSVDDDVDVGQYYLAISEEQTPEAAPEWIWDRKMDLATFKTGFLAYPPNLSLFKSGVTYYWDMMYIIDGDEYYEDAKMFKVPEKPITDIPVDDASDPDGGEINTLQIKAEAAAIPLGPPIPGVGDIPKKAEKVIKKEADKHAKQIKILIGVLLIAAMVKYATEQTLPPEIMAMIDKLNKFGDKIRSTIKDLKKFLSDINTIVQIIKIAFMAASIIALIPAVTVGIGAGVAFTMHITLANAIKQACETLQDKIGKIPFAILSIILLLLSLLKFIDLIMGLIESFREQQSDLKSEAISDSLKTADDWAAVTTVEDYNDKLKLKDGNEEKRSELMSQLNNCNYDVNFVICILLDGTRKYTTPDNCSMIGGTFNKLVACILSDGITKQMTYANCLNSGGTFDCNIDDIEHRLNNLGGPLDIPIDGICLSGPDCENLSYEECLPPNCSWSGDNLIITSLKHPDRGVTVEKATKNKGKRYGFYQKDIK